MTCLYVTYISCHTCQDEGTTKRRKIHRWNDHRRAGRRRRDHRTAPSGRLQTLGLLDHPELRGRTGVYGAAAPETASAVLRLQAQGFSLESLARAVRRPRRRPIARRRARPPRTHGRGRSRTTRGGTDTAELYGFAELQPLRRAAAGDGHSLSVVPTTVWDESEAS